MSSAPPSNPLNAPTDQENEQKGADASLSTFVSALVFNGAIFLLLIFLFSILRSHFKSIYAPRTYMVPEKYRAPVLGSGLFAWLGPIRSVQEKQLARKIGLDAYVFLRYLRAGQYLFFLFALLGCAVLLPVNLDNETIPVSGMNTLSFSHVTDDRRYWAHLILLWIFAFTTMYVMYRELMNYVQLRHAFLCSPEHRRTRQAFTILVKEIPESLRSQASLIQLFSAFGAVSSVTMAWKDDKVLEAYEEVKEDALALEGAENSLLQTGERPTMAPGKIPGVVGGGKVDAVDHLRERLVKRQERLRRERARVLGSSASRGRGEEEEDIDGEGKEEKGGKGGGKRVPNVPAAFVTFEDQRSAHLAAQSVIGASALRMSQKFVDVAPEDVMWPQLSVGGFERWGRILVSWLLTILLVILWGVIVTVVSGVANLDNLARTFDFLKPVTQWDTKIVGIIQGVIPAVVLGIVLSLPPVILRLLTCFQGIPLYSRVELSMMHKYFFFLVINVLLVVAFSGGLFKTIGILNQGFSAVIKALGEQMPSAANFFLSYVLLLTLSSAAKELLSGPAIVIEWVKLRFLGKTPRKVQGILSMDGLSWGTLFPQQVIVFSIGLVYSVLQPIILPLVFAYFLIYGLVYRYRLLYCLEQPKGQSLGGQAFPVAIYHTFVGLYVAELVLFAIFLTGVHVALMVLSIILILLTILINRYLHAAFHQVNRYLPAEFSE
ncbi:MAG: hypothetical protein DHS80DRAFT_15887, partial [Piptocephalis tieghemiana]